MMKHILERIAMFILGAVVLASGLLLMDQFNGYIHRALPSPIAFLGIAICLIALGIEDDSRIFKKNRSMKK